MPFNPGIQSEMPRIMQQGNQQGGMQTEWLLKYLRAQQMEKAAAAAKAAEATGAWTAGGSAGSAAALAAGGAGASGGAAASFD